MYPKVKVRSFEEDDEFEFDHPATPVKAFSSLTIRDYTPPAKGSKQASSLSVAKVPKLHIPRSVTPTPALPKAQVKSELESDDTHIKHSRASSIPRPRAVISSPDNDELLGSKNRTRTPRLSGLKTRNLSEDNDELLGSKNRTRTQRLSGLKSRNVSEGIRTERRLTPLSTNRNALRRVEETKKAARTSNAETKKEQTFDIIRVPRANIVKAKPCFSVT
ncbi:uncharacterized protein LOC141642261 isoform X1 [Silene latifolia]|uniref:uncharacterized protein LOC141642261 isoform X1 n=1 Tax=Silene latifolia TaxID=37657 RepID=UPI003D771E29